MKIGIVLYPTYGGSGVVATELGKALARKGHLVHFISYNVPARLIGGFVENTFYHEVGIAQYPLFDYPPYESALAGKLVDVVQFEKLDVLHVHYAIPHASAGFMAKQILKSRGIDIPMVTTLHGTDITIVGRDASLKPVVEFSIAESDAVTTVSQSLKNDTYSNFNIDRDIHVIPNFIDIEKFQSPEKSHFKKAIAPEGEKVLIHTSNFREVKRVQDIIRAFKKINAEIPSKMLLVGDGPERPKMEQLCRELGVCQDIRFLGKQEAIAELLAVADLFLMPSERESFGLAALEAMACGVPVISSNAGGLTELNVHGETGFVHDVGDVNALAKYSIELLSNDSLLDEFKSKALARARQFDINAVLPMYEDVYDLVVKAMPYPTSSNS